jgi:hypothetical protein
MRIALALTIVALCAVPAGCGSSDQATTSGLAGRAGPSGKEVRTAWEGNPACRRPRGASRWGCSVLSYRCLGVVTDRGWSISCSQPGRSIAFTIRR